MWKAAIWLLEKLLMLAAIWLLEKLLTLRGGKELWEYWAWEETPYPVGSPSWTQIAFGYRMALFPTAWVGKSSSALAEEEYFEQRRKEHGEE